MPAGDPGPGNSALRKALAVVDCVLAEPAPATLSVIARRLGLPRQSVHRLLRQLEAEGVLLRTVDPEGYAPGPRLAALALDVVRARAASAPVRAVLSGLVAAVGETCNVGVLDRDRVLYVERVECDWPLRAQLAAGDRVPVHATAIGKLLLAHLPARQRTRLLGTLDLARYTPRTVTDREALAAQLTRIRRQGYSVNDEENTEGLIGIAVPVRDPRGRVVAGLSLHAPAARLSLVRAAALRDTLDRAAAALAREIAADRAAREPV